MTLELLRVHKRRYCTLTGTSVPNHTGHSLYCSYKTPLE